MSRKETGSHFKRILSHTSSSSGGIPISHRHADFQNGKKFAKLKTTAPESDHGRYGHSYKLCPDHEPLLSRGLSTSPTSSPGNDKSPERNTLAPNFPCGNLSPLDFRQDCPRGIMSVTEIELTMGDEDHQNTSFLPPGSPMDECNSCTSTSPKSGSQNFPLLRCSKVSCSENSCLWHRCVLKLPQHIRWEDKIVTIELEKSHGESFGFNYKSKQHTGKDEIYTLVSHVDENSKAAKSGLALGDLILSANNIPMQTKQKPSEINFRTQNKLRLQVQHPLEISSKAAGYVEQLRTSMLKINEQQIFNSSVRLSQPPTPSTSPTGTGLSPTRENIPLFSLSKSEIKSQMRYYQLPKVRVFVMGSATNEFIRYFIGDVINVIHDDRARCFEISMNKSADGSVSIGNSESFSYLFENCSESCINVELISVSDDKFFHHCCSWMFTPNSVFILTFDTKRLSLSSELEMSRLCSLARTVQTVVSGANLNLRLYGITSIDDSISPEEVQTLFYTSLGKSLPDPKVIPLAKGPICQEMKQMRYDVFTMLIKICDKQKVIYPTAIALDMLVSHRGLTTTVSELAKTVEDWNMDSKPVRPESFYRVIDDLRNTGNLLVTGSMNAACISEHVKEFILPCVLFDHISHLAQCTEKDRVSIGQQDMWIALYSCGILTRTDFLDILSVCTSNPEKLLSCMEDLHLAFPVKVVGYDSGFGDVGGVLFPYFLQDVPFNTSQADSYEVYMTVEFSEDVPVSSFFSLLSELSQTDGCHSFKMRAQFVGHMILQEEDICLYFLKTSKQILIFRNRSGLTARSGVKQTIPQQVQQVVSGHIPSSVKVKVILYPEQKKINMASDLKAPFSDGSGSQPDEDGGNRREEAAGGDTDIKYEDEAVSSLPDSPEGALAMPNVPQHCAPIPTGLAVDMDNSCGAAIMPNVAAGQEPSEQERTMQTVLNKNMLDLKYIHRQLHAIYCYLSVNDTLEQFAGECGLTMAEWKLYEVMVMHQTNRLPAQAFLELYFKEKPVTLRDFMQILIRLKERQHHRLGDLVDNLWTAALHGNS